VETSLAVWYVVSMPAVRGIHVQTVTREYKDKVYVSHLLRRSYREDGKVKKDTLANLSPLGDEIVGAIRLMLAGRTLVPIEELFMVTASQAHGHVAAVETAMRRLGLERLLGSRPSKERDLAMAMIAARVVQPKTKLATTRWWRDTTLPELFNVGWADEEDLYAAMDWLLERQSDIEKKLAARHLRQDGLVLYDLSSTYVEGKKCPLAVLGYNRDGKKGKAQVNFGLITDPRGCPVSVSVFKGNTGDPTTVMPQVERLRKDFGIERMVFVGDRGMVTQKQINQMKRLDGVDWITALRSERIASLVGSGAIQMGLFDERNLFELTHADYPGERLVVCRNPDLAVYRAAKRQSLLAATQEALKKVQGIIARGRLKGMDAIGLRAGKVLGKYKVGKHFDLTIRDDGFDFAVNEERVTQEASLDGIYVVRTSLDSERLDAAGTVRSYKLLAGVERAFRSMKTMDLEVRPIHHRLEGRVRAHIFLCMLAYYVQWHMTEAWRPLTFADEDLAAKTDRDPVAPAKRSEAAQEKVSTGRLSNGSEAHSFRTLLTHLGTIVRNRCRRPKAGDSEPDFAVDTQPNPQQRRALELIAAIAA
jgi:transposase